MSKRNVERVKGMKIVVELLEGLQPTLPIAKHVEEFLPSIAGTEPILLSVKHIDHY